MISFSLCLFGDCREVRSTVFRIFQRIDTVYRVHMAQDRFPFWFCNLLDVFLQILHRFLRYVMCLHHMLPVWLRHGAQCPGFLIIFMLFSSRIPPKISLKFMLRLNANISLSSKVSANFSLVCNKCQLLSKTFLMLGKPVLYLVLNLILLSPFFLLYVRSCLRSISLTLAKCSSSIDSLYPLVWKSFLSLDNPALKTSSSAHILLTLKGCPYGIFWICDFGW